MRLKRLLLNLLILSLILSTTVNAADVNKAGRLIFLVTSIDFPDAAAASVAAAKTGGITLVTEKDTLTSDLEKAIQDYNPDQVLVVGGPLAISPNVESQVNSLGYDTVRIAGETRFDTASEIAKTFWEDGTDKVFIVRGSGRAHADAVSVVPQAALENVPILYTETEDLPEVTKNTIKYLKAKNVTIVGGPRAVSEGVENELKAIGRTVEREYGEHAHDTSKVVAEKVLSILKERGLPVDHVIVAVAKDNEDLAAGQLGVETGSPVLVIPAEGKVPEVIKGFMKDHGIDKTTVIGREETAPIGIDDDLRREGIQVNRIKGRDRVDVQLKTHNQVRVVRRAVERAIEVAGKKFDVDLNESFEKIKRNADEIADKEVRMGIIKEKIENIEEMHGRGEVPDEDYTIEKESLDDQERTLDDEKEVAENEIKVEKEKIKEKVTKLTDDDEAKVLDDVKEELGISDVVLPEGIVRRLMKGKELPPGIEKVIEKGIGFNKHYQEGKTKHEALKEEKEKKIVANIEEYKKAGGKPV